MRTDQMTGAEEQKIKELITECCVNCINTRNLLEEAYGMFTAVRDRNRVGTDERMNLEAQQIMISNLLEKLNTFIACTDYLVI